MSEAVEHQALDALRALWPGAEGSVTSVALLAHLADAGHAVPARELQLALESFQMRGWLRLTRGEATHAARDAHGPRTIIWMNPGLFA